METMPYLSISSSANLVVLEDGAVRSYPLNENQIWKIGRKNPESENDIELESKIVSRKHGQIQSVDGEWYYIDNGSLNGTYYNGSKIKANDHGEFDAVKLSNGDILRIDSDSLDYPEERGVFFLFTTEGIGNQWKTVTLNKKEISFGRNEENDITIPLSYVSGKHMVIRRRDNEYFVMDCDSMAGTWLNGEEIHGEAKLKEKDMIAICDCIMILCGNKIIYNIPVLKNRTTKQSIEEVDLSDHPVILCADIKSRKVKNNRGFGKKELIKDIKLEIQEGTLVAIIGGTGAGKSTVMNCLNGSDTGGMEGSIEYKGIDLIKKFSQMKWIIGSVPQENIFNEEMTVEEQLIMEASRLLPKDSSKAEIKDSVNRTLKQLGIESVRNNQIAKCSGGEKRRVSIGMELVADKQFLCLDEPEANLDPGNKRNLFETLRNLAHSEGKLILSIIHDVSDIDLFDKIIIMNKVDNVGRLAFSGTPNEAREDFGREIKEIYNLIENKEDSKK